MKTKNLLIAIVLLFIANGLMPGFVYAQDSASASSNSPVCKGGKLHLYASNGGSSYKWTGPDKFKSSAQNPVRDNVTAAMAGTYTVIINFPAAPVTLTTKVHVGDPAEPGNINGDREVCKNNTAYYSIAPVAGATSYLWTVPTGAHIDSGQGTISIIVTFGTKSGDVTVKAVNHCSTSAARSIAVVVETCTGTRTMQTGQPVVNETNTVVYPNPANGLVTVRFNSNTITNYTVNVFDMTGRMIRTEEASATEGINLHTLDLSNLTTGLYTISLEIDGTDRQIMRVALQ